MYHNPSYYIRKFPLIDCKIKKFVTPINKNPGKHYICEILGYRKQDDENIIIVKAKPKKNNYYYIFNGIIEILEKDLQVVKAEYWIESDHSLYEYMTQTFTGLKDLLSKFMLKKTLRMQWFYKKQSNQKWIFEKIISNINYLLKNPDQESQIYTSTRKSVCLFYGYDTYDHFVIDEDMTGQENDLQIIENINYNPNFWIENNKIINEISLEDKIIHSFNKSGFIGDLLPNSLSLYKNNETNGLDDFSRPKN